VTVVEAGGGAATLGAGSITTVGGWAAGGLVTVVQAVMSEAAPIMLRTRASEVIEFMAWRLCEIDFRLTYNVYLCRLISVNGGAKPASVAG
jgi:hypothetical protein